jgi:hypothetical protein
MIQDCFDHTDWDMFWVASENNIDEYTHMVAEFIRKCTGDVVPIVTIKTYPRWQHSPKTESVNQTTSFNHGKGTGNMAEYKQCSYSLCFTIKQAESQYRDKMELQFNGSDTRHIVPVKRVFLYFDYSYIIG